MSRYLTDPIFAPTFLPGTHVGLDGPSDQCSVHCANNCWKAKRAAEFKDAGDSEHVSDSVSSSSSSTSTRASSLPNTTTTTPTPTPTDPAQTRSRSDETLPPTSPFTDKLHTNYIPSVPEIAEIKRYVSLVDGQLAGYDARIAELEATLHEMHHRRRQLHELTTAHKALSSPFRRLPPEILQVIFVWCLPQTRNAVMHASEAPVLLGRVCSEWRRISLATPELWASLHIVPPNVNFTSPASSAARFKRKRDLIEMWLLRSGACPLSVSMVWFAGDSEAEVELCGTLLAVLVPLCARWRSLDFQVPLKMFRPFVGLKVVDVPLLEALTLMDNRTPADTDAVTLWPDSLNFAESASALRTFTLTFFSGGIKLPAIPWSRLTTLYLESNIAFFFTDAKEMLAVLDVCVELRQCTLKFPLSHTAPLPAYEKLDVPTVHLPELEVLCLDGDQHLMNTFHMNNTLGHLRTPKLRRLEILGRAGRPEGLGGGGGGGGTGNDSDLPEPLVALKELLGRSECPLEKLNLESMTMVPEEFIACLRLVPTLDELVVHNWTARVFTPAIATAAGVGVGVGVGVGMAQEQEGEDEDEEDEEGQESAGSGGDVMDVPENQILRALTVSKSKDDFEVGGKMKMKAKDVRAKTKTKDGKKRDETVDPPGVQTDNNHLAEPDEGDEQDTGHGDNFESGIPNTHSSSSSSSSSSPSIATDALTAEPTIPSLLPNLQKFDFTLCDASQHLLCNFIASRWDNPPAGVQRLKSVKSNFTAVERDEVRERMQRYKAGGLEVSVIYQVPMSDELNPSPWTGLEGPP